MMTLPSAPTTPRAATPSAGGARAGPATRWGRRPSAPSRPTTASTIWVEEAAQAGDKRLDEDTDARDAEDNEAGRELDVAEDGLDEVHQSSPSSWLPAVPTGYCPARRRGTSVAVEQRP